MNIKVDVYVHTDEHNSQKLDTIISFLKGIQRKEEAMATDLTALTAQVKANEDVEASAVLLIQGLAAQITAAGTDPVALKALSDGMKTSADALAAAIAANTPAA
jgi:hypothetical protein